MKPTKLLECVKMLKQNGFTLLRSNGHSIYGNGRIRIALAHQKYVSPGVLRSVMKAIAMAKSEIEGRSYG
jgi:predicted RNA binding protein YcfA (HicA-like mRNA interferase family)